MRFVSSRDRKAVAQALKPVYTAVSAAAAEEALEEFAASQWGR
jgi:putative transposase